MPRNAVLVAIIQRINLNMYRQECLPSCSSIKVLKRSANTSRPSLVCLFFYNSKRNCYMWQPYIWHLWDKKTRPSSGTLDTDQTFISVGGSWKWCYTANKVWWRFFHIIRWLFQRGFYWSKELLGKRQGTLCTCLIFGGFTPFTREFIFFIWVWDSFL